MSDVVNGSSVLISIAIDTQCIYTLYKYKANNKLLCNYAHVSFFYIDVNECSNLPCDHYCNNTNGSFNCSCQPGFLLINGSKCEDINECVTDVTRGCHNCTNRIGGFECLCSNGFYLNKTSTFDCQSKLKFKLKFNVF